MRPKTKGNYKGEAKMASGDEISHASPCRHVRDVPQKMSRTFENADANVLGTCS
jgi:hypothetical protein